MVLKADDGVHKQQSGTGLITRLSAFKQSLGELWLHLGPPC